MRTVPMASNRFPPCTEPRLYSDDPSLVRPLGHAPLLAGSIDDRGPLLVLLKYIRSLDPVFVEPLFVGAWCPPPYVDIGPGLANPRNERGGGTRPPPVLLRLRPWKPGAGAGIGGGGSRPKRGTVGGSAASMDSSRWCVALVTLLWWELALDGCE